MRFPLALLSTIILLSCSDNKSGSGSDADTTGIINSDSVTTGNSGSSSEFNKGNSSPPGATGGVDSATATGGAVPDKTDVDKRHPEVDKMKDSIGKKNQK